jgi:hypothetical protein
MAAADDGSSSAPGRGTGDVDTAQCAVWDAPLLEKIGQFRAPGRLVNSTVAERVA